jgi:aldehyde:ferredoxin oxidoreductase
MATLLKIDLTAKKIETEDITSLQHEYIGGLGVNTKLASELIPAGCSPLDGNNVLLVGPGSLAGTLLPTACRTEITSKSPLSGRFGTANSGSEWGVRLRMAGYDYLAISGQATQPTVLYIDNGTVYLEEAAHLWGEDTWFTTDWIKKHKGEDFAVASIGPAGENLVAFASIQNNHFSSWGRTGLGAVMGSKNLKAIAVRGKGKLPLCNEKEFPEIRKEALQKIKGDQSFGWTRKYGSMVVSTPYNRIGALPGRNFTAGTLPGWDETRGRKFFLERYKEKDLACFSCPIACSHWSRVKEGPFKNYESKGLEVTYALEFGARLDMHSIPEILKCVEICNRLGMDVISCAATIAFLLECCQEKLVKKADIGFLPGWDDYRSFVKLMHMISFKEGIGEVLAGGVKRASKQIPGSEPFALHVKGVEMGCRDPRAKPDVWALGYLTNTRGGDHLRARSPVELLAAGFIDGETEELGVSRKEIEKLDMPSQLKAQIFGSPPSRVSIPLMIKYAEDLITIINSVGFCIRPPVLRTLGPEFYARALNCVTGSNFSADSLLDTAARIWALQHRFNREAGESPGEYSFPERFYREALPRGEGESPHPPLSRENVQKVMEAYFKSRHFQYHESESECERERGILDK